MRMIAHQTSLLRLRITQGSPAQHDHVACAPSCIADFIPEKASGPLARLGGRTKAAKVVEKVRPGRSHIMLTLAQ